MLSSFKMVFNKHPFFYLLTVMAKVISLFVPVVEYINDRNSTRILQNNL